GTKPIETIIHLGSDNWWTPRARCRLARGSISIRGRGLRRLLRGRGLDSFSFVSLVYLVGAYLRDGHIKKQSGLGHQSGRRDFVHVRGLDRLAKSQCDDSRGHRWIFPGLLLVAKNSTATSPPGHHNYRSTALRCDFLPAIYAQIIALLY